MIDGEVFVNEKLTAGLIRTANGIYYVFGHTDDQNYNEDLFSYIKTSIENREEIYIVYLSDEWEMMIEERFSHVLRNIPRMKFQSVTFEGENEIVTKIHMK